MSPRIGHSSVDHPQRAVLKIAQYAYATAQGEDMITGLATSSIVGSGSQRERRRSMSCSFVHEMHRGAETEADDD